MNKFKLAAAGATLAFSALVGYGAIGATTAKEKKDGASKATESSIVTNENGSVSRTYVESSITTNGNLVTEHRRETRTEMDGGGNVLRTSTSEYAQSYNVGDTGMTPLAARAADAADAKPASTDAFLGLGFGTAFASTNFVQDADEPALLRATFVPKKPLAGFDDYYVYVTPKTHKVVKVCACAKEAVDPGVRGRRHYLIEALEKRYGAWARLCSFRLPYYAFDVAPERYVTVCLAGASDDYETVLAAWDNAVARTAADEYEELRREARKNAAAQRQSRISAAADAF